MAEMNLPMNRSAGRRIGSAALNAPRLVMSWEDWLTLAAALVTFLSIALSIQAAHWVQDMPPLVPTAMAGLLIGMIAARIRFTSIAIHPVALVLGVFAIALVVQTYADGVTVQERLADVRQRMTEWFDVVRSGDISNDNLPFVVLVHSICFLAAYMASWSLYRWRNAWVAIVPGAVVLLANISFQRGQPSGAFIAFLFGALLLVTRVHLQRLQDRWAREGIDYPEFISLSAGQLTLLLTTGLMVVAWAVPLGTQAAAAKNIADWVTTPFTGESGTFSRLFHNVNSQKGANLHSFADTLPIQSNVKLGNQVVLQINSSEPGPVRGTSYDYYTGTGWKATGRTAEDVSGKELAADQTATGYDARNVTILKVTVVDGFDTILTAGTPLGTNVASTVEKNRNFAGDIQQLLSRHSFSANDTYNSFGTESTATADQLQAAGTTYPDWVAQEYLQLPAELPQRVADLTKSVAAGATTPYDQAKAIETYLRSFPADLDVPSPPAKRDTVDFFLFDLKRGYFDYQATAMAVMLRTLGIPSRVAVGYYLDPTTAQGTTYSVRRSDAYSWVEVFFPQYGWVNFNPTQDRPAGGAGGVGSGIVGQNDPGQDPALQDLFNDTGDTTPPAVTAALNETPVAHSSPPWMLIWSLTAALVVLTVSTLSARFAWNWGLSGLDGPSKLWARVQRLAGWAKLSPRRDETPREWSRRLGTAIEHEPETTKLAAAFEEARYGRPDQRSIDESEAQSAYRPVRNALLSRVLRRKRR
jgi:transglutaminase-like putative cysteine protease